MRVTQQMGVFRQPQGKSVLNQQQNAFEVKDNWFVPHG
jgi:hypothetical protein